MNLSEAERADRARLEQALRAHRGVFAAVAAELEIDERTVARRAKRYGLDGLAEKRNPRLRARRQNKVCPPAPHEVSRQAQEQAEHRALGLCKCGKPPAKTLSGRLAKSCAGCLEWDRQRKRGARPAGDTAPPR